MPKRRTMTTDRKADYAVGYGKPRVQTRFKKGNRANRAARRRGAKGLKAVLAKILDRRIVVAEDGKRRKVTKRELGFARLVDKFSDGDLPAAKLLMEFELALERRAPDEPAVQSPLDEHDKEVIRNWVDKGRHDPILRGDAARPAAPPCRPPLRCAAARRLRRLR
jgi:hypothetical protein